MLLGIRHGQTLSKPPYTVFILDANAHYLPNLNAHWENIYRLVMQMMLKCHPRWPIC